MNKIIVESTWGECKERMVLNRIPFTRWASLLCYLLLGYLMFSKKGL